ncbi:MAG: hypothetical protein WCE49_01280, partial [Terrimicrobiaceae bacterium]
HFYRVPPSGDPPLKARQEILQQVERRQSNSHQRYPSYGTTLSDVRKLQKFGSRIMFSSKESKDSSSPEKKPDAETMSAAP